MVAPAPIPPGEEARLAALHNHEILDTPPDERFDLFTQLGGWIFATPLSAINFVDRERTFYKSLIGMPSYEPRRDSSICAHAIAGSEPIMVVEDLSLDRRFQDHDLVTQRGLRFYAGAVLYTAAGHALGTLCIGGKQPRRFPGEDRQKLIVLAKGVGSVLDLHRQSRLLRQAATQDSLTGLDNRRRFTEMLDAAIADATQGIPCALLALDLDGFKQVNDSLGHAAGDALLCEVGRRLLQTVRAGDLVARLGGDEFVILVRGAAATGSCAELAVRVLDAFAHSFLFEDGVVPIRSSIGIARCPQEAMEAHALLRRADAALYKAKQFGGGRWHL